MHHTCLLSVNIVFSFDAKGNHFVLLLAMHPYQHAAAMTGPALPPCINNNTGMRNPVFTSMQGILNALYFGCCFKFADWKVPGIDENAFSIQSPLIQYSFACWSISPEV